MNNPHDRKLAADDALRTFQALLNCAQVRSMYKMEEEDILAIMNKINELKDNYGKV